LADAPFHARSCEDVARSLHTDLTTGTGAGLSVARAAERLASDGPNTIVHAKPPAAFRIFLSQFRSLLVGLLVAAVIIALFMGDRVEALAIVAVLLINALLGYFTERKAARALEGLREHTVHRARLRRGGEEREIDASGLVQGDLVILSEGDRVPADGRVVAATSLAVDEATLTGESVPTAKSIEPVEDPDAAIGDRSCMVYAGTAVTAGHGRFVVTAIGSATEVGRLGGLVEAAAQRNTPLELKLAGLSRALVVLVLGLCAIIVFIGWLRGNPLVEMLEVGLSLAIAAVPEGLLAVTTVTLAVGMQRMAAMHALVRRLPAVETLGSITVICTDKTGTLTQNEMTVSALDVAGRRIDVSGTGYDPSGELREAGVSLPRGGIEAGEEAPDDALHLALQVGALCNDAKVERNGGQTSALGDPTELALLVVAEKAGVSLPALATTFPRTDEVPFRSETQRMVTVHETPDGAPFACVKGAPLPILEACDRVMETSGIVPLTPEKRRDLLARNEALAHRALRVLALAHRTLPPGYEAADLGRGLVFVGLVGMADPLRREARATIEACRGAGIRAIMITGDQVATAAAIGSQLGLEVGLAGQPMGAVHGRDLANLDDAGWDEIVARTSVFARVSPEHKLVIVKTLQRRGEIVAMTGDGVNDAPALRQADIGIAMGIRGTEAAKEAADMVLVDDDFSTLVHAIEQGRVVVHNILRFVHYLFSTNFAEIGTVVGAIALDWPLPLGVLQILWLNLVTDVFPAMALALEPSAPQVMSLPPRDPDEPLMTPRFAWLIVWQGLTLTVCTLGGFALALRWYGRVGPGLVHAETIAFMTLGLAQIAHSFNVRSRQRSLFAAGLFTNRWIWGAAVLCIGLQIAAVTIPPLRTVLHTAPLVSRDWLLVSGLSLLPVVVVELVKLVKRLHQSTNRGPAPARIMAQAKAS
jgi:P-type Ca2+ transporter type 2C